MINSMVRVFMNVAQHAHVVVAGQQLYVTEFAVLYIM